MNFAKYLIPLLVLVGGYELQSGPSGSPGLPPAEGPIPPPGAPAPVVPEPSPDPGCAGGPCPGPGEQN